MSFQAKCVPYSHLTHVGAHWCSTNHMHWLFHAVWNTIGVYIHAVCLAKAAVITLACQLFWFSLKSNGSTVVACPHQRFLCIVAPCYICNMLQSRSVQCFRVVHTSSCYKVACYKVAPCYIVACCNFVASAGVDGILHCSAVLTDMLQVVQLREPRQLYGMYSGLWGPRQTARWFDCSVVFTLRIFHIPYISVCLNTVPQTITEIRSRPVI